MTARAPSQRPDLVRMLAVLDQENRALMQADMPKLMRLAPRKQAILARLEAGAETSLGDDAQIAQQVQSLASRNARLFEAALRGLGDARSLIDRLKGRRSDQTYARDGARRFVEPPPTTLEKRA